MAWEFENDRPIYTQLLEKIQQKIISGEYAPGDRLLSVRDLAAQAAVNPNTMQRALIQLESNGLLINQRTSGRTVTNDKELIQRIRKEMAMDQISKFMTIMNGLGYTKNDMIQMMSEL